MRLPHIILLVTGMALAWYIGYRAGLLEAATYYAAEPRVHTHE